MKKIFLNEMETERRNELIKNNKKLIERLQNDLYNTNMERQGIDAEYILGKNWHNYIEYHDNYNSFFLTVKDWRKLIDNIDINYLSDESIKLYHEIIENITIMEKEDTDSEKYHELDEKNEEKTKIILKDVEDLLHDYEEYPEEDDAIQYADEMEQLNEYYVEEHEDGFCDGVIRCDVSYTETFI